MSSNPDEHLTETPIDITGKQQTVFGYGGLYLKLTATKSGFGYTVTLDTNLPTIEAKSLMVKDSDEVDDCFHGLVEIWKTAHSAYFKDSGRVNKPSKVTIVNGKHRDVMSFLDIDFPSTDDEQPI